VQGHLLALATSLSLNHALDDPAGRAEVGVFEVLAHLDSEPVDATVSARQEIGELVSLWSDALDLSWNIDEAAWNLLETDFECRARFVDVISEAFTNILRHGISRAAQLRVSASKQMLLVTVTSHGHVNAQRTASHGLELIERRTEQWSLTESSPGIVTLTAAI
jgi:anti-sigma regulatory factor (Ser/Thr protein kinase)